MPKKITKTVYTFAELIAREKDRPKDAARSRAVDKARSWLQEGQGDDEWWDSTYADWKTALSQIGFENADIQFSGFASQGDGASFTADVNLPKLIEFLSVPREGSNVVSSPDGVTDDFREWLVKKCGGVAFDPRYAKIARFAGACEMRVVRADRRYSHKWTCGIESDFADHGELVPTGKESRGYPATAWSSKQKKCRELWEAFVGCVEQLRLDVSDAIYENLEEENDYLMSDEQLLQCSEDYMFTAGGVFEK